MSMNNSNRYLQKSLKLKMKTQHFTTCGMPLGRCLEGNLSALSRKEEISQIHDLSFKLKKLQKRVNKTQTEEKKENNLKIRAENNKIKNRKIIQKAKKIKAGPLKGQ